MALVILLFVLFCGCISIASSGLYEILSVLTAENVDVVSEFSQYSAEPTLHYKMGYVSFLKGESHWINYFASGLSMNQTDRIDCFKIFLDLCKSDADVDRAIALLTDQIHSNAIDYHLLIEFTRDRQRYVDYYISLVSALLVNPEDYMYWTKFTEFLDKMKDAKSSTYRALHRIVYKPLIDRLILIGLMFYPRNAELLIHQAAVYVNSNNFECASHILGRAAHLSTKLDSALALLQLLSEIEINVNATWADTHCYPLGVHTTEMHHHFTSGLFEDLPPVKSGELLSIYHLPDYLKTPYQPVGDPYVGVNLQVGCSNWKKCVRQGWIIADAVDVPSTHFVTQAQSLSMIESASVLNVYSSHTLEHLSHYAEKNEKDEIVGLSEICMAVKEWNRVLIPGGLVLVSVPDAEAMFELFLRPTTTDELKGVILKILYGGQENLHNRHLYGFYYAKLKEVLEVNGFCEVQKVEYFDLFDDTSQTTIAGVPLSLNIAARKCPESDIDSVNPIKRCII